LDVREQLIRLVRIQEMAQQTAASRRIVDEAPGHLEEIENRFRERNAEYVAVKERFDALEADRNKRSDDLETLEEHRDKYQADLMQVQNQREYAAMLKEIDAVKSQIAENEEAVLKDMEELETVKVELASHEAHINEERKTVERERKAVEEQVAEAHRTIETLEAERARNESDLPAQLAAAIHRLEHGRSGVFLSKAVDGTCQTCYVRVRPQVFQEIRTAVKIHACSNCRRFLYHEPTLVPNACGDGEKSSSEVEAVDGGAV
jgi:predicted  nucleic acid-binding Zn-ribbon protein